MINEIYVNGEILIENKPRSFFKDGYTIRCTECDELINRKWFDYNILNKKYICKSCNLHLNNPMFNKKIKKKHNKIVTSIDYRENMKIKTSGDKNGFYGKKHTEETKNKIKKKFKDWLNNLSKNEYEEWTKKMSDGNIKLMSEKPEFYKKIKSDAARKSHRKQYKNKKMNNIEKKVDDFLKTLNIKYKFSIILGNNQYDFGIEEKRILIEVDGDYWHGNPKYYNIDGSDGKRKLNDIQIKKIKQDKKKSIFAKEHNFKLLRIWEHDINNNNFKNIIKNEIN